MLKETITYTNFNNQQVSRELRFNISKTELLDRIELKDELENLGKQFEGPERELTNDEIKTIINVVKNFMKMGYGEISEDGEEFRKSEEIWDRFTNTAAYDAFLMTLFSDGGVKAINFMRNVIPADLLSDVDAEVERLQNGSGITTPEVPTAPPVLDATDEVDVDALLEQMPEDAPPASPITQKQADFLKTKLSQAQYDKHMLNRTIVN